MDASIATKPSANGQAATRNIGRIEEIQGVVIEAVFSEKLPEINHAITIARPKAAAAEEAPGISSSVGEGVLVCEVQQHLGDDRVRAVAMDTTDGLARGMEVLDTGGPITVPVGQALGKDGLDHDALNLLDAPDVALGGVPVTGMRLGAGRLGGGAGVHLRSILLLFSWSSVRGCGPMPP